MVLLKHRYRVRIHRTSHAGSANEQCRFETLKAQVGPFTILTKGESVVSWRPASKDLTDELSPKMEGFD